MIGSLRSIARSIRVVRCLMARCVQSRPRSSLRVRFVPRLEALENRLAPATSISITNSQVVEGNNGTANMDFTVTRTGDLTSTVVVSYKTVDGTGVSGTDYQGTNNGTATIPSGSATGDILVPGLGNTVNQANRTFSVQLTGIVNVIGPPVTLAAQQTFSVGSGPISVAVGDINGDGLPDLVVANYDKNGPGSVSVLLDTTAPGATTPTFAPQVTFATGTRPMPWPWPMSTVTACPTSSPPTLPTAR